jgi:RHS repeat-associated protein
VKNFGVSQTVDGETTSYGYDAASQLTSEMRPGYSASYTFDGNGNRLSKAVNGVTEFYSYDDGDKLLSAGVKTYTYDLAGRTTSVKVGMGAPSVLTYDDEDRLKTFMGQTYTYNGFDTRVGKNAGGSVTAYHRDGAGVTAPLISDSGATYTPGISERRNGVSTFLNAGLKDVAKQTDISGNVTATRKYDAYGMVIGSTGTWKGPFGYSGSAGYQEDETGLQLLGHRYYDSSTGRFITRDPIKDGRNWYAYCDNNPVNAIDANGLWKAIIVVGKYLWVDAASIQYQIMLLRAMFLGAGASEVVVMNGPTEQEMVDALSDDDVQGAAYLGHGPDTDVAKGGTWQSELNDSEIFDASTMGRIARNRRTKMALFVLAACEGQNAVKNLSSISNVILYANGPYDAMLLATLQMEKWCSGMALPKQGIGKRPGKGVRRGKIGGGGRRTIAPRL